jgi:hypothetical protein
MGGHVVLGMDVCANFVLLVRILPSLRVAFRPLDQPSGFVPGLCWGSDALMLFVAVEIQGLNFFHAIYFRVFFAEVWGSIVISLFFLGLLVIVHPQLE